MEKRISKKQLVNLLMKIKGPSFATLITETVPSMQKTLNPYWDRVVKRAIVKVIISSNYTNSVNNRRKKEGKNQNFVADPARWGTKVADTSLTEHQGSYYLQARMQDGQRTIVSYLEKDKRWEFKKKMEKLKPFLRLPRSNAEHQGVDQEVVIRTYALSSILEIKVNGHHYIIKQPKSTK